jgi:hypothetical protein
VREPEAEEYEVILLRRAPLEQVGDDIVNMPGTGTLPIECQDFRRCIDRGYRGSGGRELARPETCARGKIEDCALRHRPRQRLLNDFEGAEPGHAVLLAPVIAPFSQKPLVILGRARAVVLDHFLDHGAVVRHACHGIPLWRAG